MASRLDWVASPSCELTEWPAWDFCPVVQQLTWLFSSLACFTCVLALATCQPRANCEIQSRGLVKLHTSELFFTLSHTLPLHDSYLNIGFLSDKLQANWHGIKPTKLLIKFNLTITKSYYNMITIHTHVINPLYFLIIKLYKIILYLYCIHKYPHTLLFTQITL